MQTSTKLFKGLCTLLLLVAIGFAVKGCGHMRDARCAAEGQAAVEAFLRSGASGAFTNVLGFAEDGRSVITNNYGSFVKMERSGFSHPYWNIQGYNYLTLDRTGIFARGTIPIKIFVTEGRVTAPGSKNVGQPRMDAVNSDQGATIFVSHPQLRP